jgi:hypothetical protein
MIDPDEQAQHILRIALKITNPGLSGPEMLKLANNWFDAALLVATKWHIPVSEVLDIAEKLDDTEDMFEPLEDATQEQKIYWDYVNECNQFDHIQGE